MVIIMNKNRANRLFPLVVILIILVYVYGSNIGKVQPILDQSIGNHNVGEITDGTEITQSFYSPVNNVSGISVKLGTYMRQNKGKLTIGIKSYDNNRIIYSTTVKAESIIDNNYFDYRFPPIKNSKDNKYNLFIYSEGSSNGDSITAYISNQNIYKHGNLYINGSELQGELVFKVHYNKTLFNLIGL